MSQKGIEVKIFTLNQNVRICLKCILTKFELSTPFRFQNIAVQNWPFYAYFTVAILSVL